MPKFKALEPLTGPEGPVAIGEDLELSAKEGASLAARGIVQAAPAQKETAAEKKDREAAEKAAADAAAAAAAADKK